jgi:hypothetical protein
MRKVHMKIIVSTADELPYVLMNLLELSQLVDFFWITEANYSISGEKKGYEFEDSFKTHIQQNFDNVKYIKMDLSANIRALDSESASEILHSNEKLTRTSFTDNFHFKNPHDIMIAVDGDEVIHNSIRLRFLVFLLKVSPKNLKICYLVTLRQFMYFLNLFMDGYDFYGPVIAHVCYFSNGEKRDWRTSGKRIKSPLGSHFSWIMEEIDMKRKIMRYAHRDALAKFADEAVLYQVRRGNYNLFDPTREFNAVTIESSTHRIFPKKLRSVSWAVKDALVINPDEFWASK